MPTWQPSWRAWSTCCSRTASGAVATAVGKPRLVPNTAMIALPVQPLCCALLHNCPFPSRTADCGVCSCLIASDMGSASLWQQVLRCCHIKPCSKFTWELQAGVGRRGGGHRAQPCRRGRPLRLGAAAGAGNHPPAQEPPPGLTLGFSIKLSYSYSHGTAQALSNPTPSYREIF